MAYCPKCGVEVDNSVSECPLCDFPIPDINGPDMVELGKMNKYPKVDNIYSAYLEGMKNQVYFVVIVLLVSTLLILTVIDGVFNVETSITNYFYLVTFALAAYIYFGLGFLRWSINITGIAVTTVFLTFSINSITGGGWFTTYALPICILVYLNSIAFHYMFMHSSRKNRFGYLPSFVLLIVSSLCIGIDGIVSWNLVGRVRLTWSLVAVMGCMCVAFILHFGINRIPDSTKETIRRKFHL